MKKSLLYLSWVFLCCIISPVNGNAACLKMKPGQNCEKQTLTGVLGDAAVPCFDEICPPCATPVLLVDNTTYYLNDVDEIDIENLLFDSFENLMHETITVTGEVFNENGYFFINISTMEKVEAHIYEPMLVKGRMWTEEVFCDVTMDGKNTYTYSDSIWIEKDTFINEQQYYKFSSGIIMREDTEKQEVYSRISDTDYLIYKFNVNIGDTLLSKNLIDFALGLHCKFDYLVTDIDILGNHRTITLFPIIADTLNADEYTKMAYSDMMTNLE